MGINTNNVLVTPMQVVFDNVDIGGTDGGVKFSAKHEFTDIMIDQFGKSPVDSVLTGQSYSVKMTFAEIKDKDAWKRAFPSMKLVDDGTNKMMYFDAQPGDSLLARAKQLKIHPMRNASTDKSGDFLFYKAACKSAVEVEYSSGKQSGLEVEFVIFPDTTTDPARYFVHGDPSVGLVAATLVQTSFTGTGNGTISGLTAGSAAKDETLTLTCIHAAANAGKFEVIGSVSGPLGVATVGSLFTSAAGSFTIGDGSTDFIVGDVFVLTSTAANYA